MRTKALLTIQPPPAKWSLIACYENFLQETRVVLQQIVANSRGQKRELARFAREFPNN